MRIKILNVLKKYSRAAEDRNQWRKVEAMSSELDQTGKAGAREFRGKLCHVTIVLYTVRQRGTVVLAAYLSCIT